MQKHTGEEKRVVENSRRAKILGQQPANLKDVLVQPVFKLAQQRK